MYLHTKKNCCSSHLSFAATEVVIIPTALSLRSSRERTQLMPCLCITWVDQYLISVMVKILPSDCTITIPRKRVRIKIVTAHLYESCCNNHKSENNMANIEDFLGYTPNLYYWTIKNYNFSKICLDLCSTNYKIIIKWCIIVLHSWIYIKGTSRHSKKTIILLTRVFDFRDLVILDTYLEIYITWGHYQKSIYICTVLNFLQQRQGLKCKCCQHYWDSYINAMHTAQTFECRPAPSLQSIIHNLHSDVNADFFQKKCLPFEDNLELSSKAVGNLLENSTPRLFISTSYELVNQRTREQQIRNELAKMHLPMNPIHHISLHNHLEIAKYIDVEKLLSKILNHHNIDTNVEFIHQSMYGNFSKSEKQLDFCQKTNGDHEFEKYNLFQIMGQRFKLTYYTEMIKSRRKIYDVFPLHKTQFSGQQSDLPQAQGQRNGSNRDAIHHLMRYEVIRLCSFSFTEYPRNVDMWVTLLAQSGFYVVGAGGRVRCFSCGCEYADFLVGSSIDNAHGPQCRRHEYNRPLNEWTNGLNTEDLVPYFTEFGSLTPNLFNDSGTIPNATYHGDNGNNLSVPQTVSSGYVLDSSAAVLNGNRQSEHLNRGNEVSYTGFSEIGDYTETPKPSSAPLMGNVDSNYVYFTSEAHSLPTYLNTVSGALVSQESHESNSREVLTSVARQPMSIDNAPTQRASNVQAQDGQDQNSSEEGAVGGSVLPSFDLSRASYPQFASSTARRTTFNGWNPDHPQRPEDLVAGGFFYAGYADCVRCFYCGLGLKYWRPNDIPAYQHARFRPHCVYNRMYKGQEYIDRVQQDIQIEQTQANQTGAETTQAPTVPTPSTPSTAGSTNSSSTSDPEHAYLRLTVAQEALRAGWRSEQIIQAVSHIVEEIGITSQSIQLDILIDVLVSLYSANDQPEAPNLSSGDSDSAGDSSRNIGDRPVDPNIATVRPTIPASVTSKLAERAPGFEQADGGDDDHAETNEVSDGPNTLEMTQAVERENAYLSQRTMCGICHERPVSCVFLPCGHVIACQPCADISTTCKLCHKNIVATANIFLA